MSTDFLGNDVSTDDPAALAAIDDFVGGLISYQTRIANILSAAHPGAPALVQVYVGVLHLLAETTGAEATALPYLHTAQAASASANARELRWIEVLRDWIAGDIDATIAALEAILADHPTDLGALKLLQYHLFNRGEFAAMLRPALAVQERAGDLPYLGGMLAFAYEQLHLLDEAQAAAQSGLAIVPDDPWAQHALAHVWLTRGSIDTGLSALEAWAPGWVGLNSFMVTHLWWHLALFYLSKGRNAAALGLYDDHVWAHDRSYSQDQVGAVSLLARLEAAGIDVGSRWSDLAAHLAARSADTLLPFLSVQYLYGLARAGRGEADALLEAIAQRAEQDAPGGVWRLAALPLSQGLLHHARGAFAAAVPLLSEAVPRLAHLGGSHAQRDLFDVLRVDALVRSGDWAAAQQALEVRRASDPDGVPINTALAQVYDALDLPVQAAVARARLA
ncbi:tetratricopeptide repeat protein [Novosphingobium sp. FKTRR1]|uniref:tetratricopeptide repeat protein n=1 Tax=Novosphingobium sp. FKTRR1 TaxID=2879118 RepID=UPI001CF05817